jgi:hypothetical protein
MFEEVEIFIAAIAPQLFVHEAVELTAVFVACFPVKGGNFENEGLLLDLLDLLVSTYEFAKAVADELERLGELANPAADAIAEFLYESAEENGDLGKLNIDLL